jgi:hypothetical protein
MSLLLWPVTRRQLCCSTSTDFRFYSCGIPLHGQQQHTGDGAVERRTLELKMNRIRLCSWGVEAPLTHNFAWRGWSVAQLLVTSPPLDSSFRKCRVDDDRIGSS